MSNGILLIDNYDSFVFNLARYLEELGVETEVIRNDRITVNEIRERSPSAIVLSPGPCTPDEAGICVDLLQQLGKKIPMLGVCLGHQALGVAFGGKVIRAHEPIHGRTSLITHQQAGLFAECANPLRVTRYHSLIVEKSSLPDDLVIISEAEDGTIMGLQHRKWPLFGVQFHPESVLTQQGHTILSNFLQLAGVTTRLGPSLGDLPVKDDRSDDFFQKKIEISASRMM
ncbi:anthranilate synthase component II [Planctomicrobium sp. SH668]|uniref:anthranilate synthase component II n=1 Tax=Planctomicrobium sp. SH668 TaxID=3448126 RepID=UPI003F5C2CF0